MYRLDDVGNPVKIYATSSLDPYPFVLIMTSESLFGDIRSFSNVALDYDTYLRRHWERESVLPRLSYMDPRKLDEACAYMITYRKNNFKVTSFRMKIIRQYTRSVSQFCARIPLLKGQICAASHRDYRIQTRWLQGAPVLVNLGGRVFVVGQAVREADYRSTTSIITVNSIYDAYQNIGCNDFLFGEIIISVLLVILQFDLNYLKVNFIPTIFPCLKVSYSGLLYNVCLPRC